MSLQAYLDNIRSKTGKTPDDFRKAAMETGVFQPDMKAGELVAWLKQEYGLGHGHSMAIWQVFKSSGWVNAGKR